MVVPVIVGSLDRERVVVGAHALFGYTQRARLEALRRGRVVALKVEMENDDTLVTLIEDGNGNGVLQREIEAGVDTPIGGVERLSQHARSVSLRINQAIPDIGSGAPLVPGDDPLRIGRASLVAFSPMGSSTGGTLYVAAASGPQMALRLFGATGRTRVMIFNAASRRWEPH